MMNKITDSPIATPLRCSTSHSSKERMGRFLFATSLLCRRPLFEDHLQLQHGLADLDAVLGLEFDALAGLDAGAVDAGDAAAGVGNAQAVLFVPDHGERFSLHP